MNQCNNLIVGVKNTSVSYMIEAVIEQLDEYVTKECRS